MKKLLLPVALLLVTAPASAGLFESKYKQALRELGETFEERCSVYDGKASAKDEARKFGYDNQACEALRTSMRKIIEAQAKLAEIKVQKELVEKAE